MHPRHRVSEIVQHLRPKRQLGRRLAHVHLEEPRQLYLRGELVQGISDGAVGWLAGAEGTPIEFGKRALDRSEASTCEARLRGLRQRSKVGDDLAHWLRSGNRGREI